MYSTVLCSQCSAETEMTEVQPEEVSHLIDILVI